MIRVSTKLQASSLRSVLASPIAFFSTHHPGVVFDRLSSDGAVSRGKGEKKGGAWLPTNATGLRSLLTL